MPDIIANGIRIHYEERGAGPPMVWAHGLFATWRAWEETMAFFQDRYRVIAYDARGHGRSEVPDRPEAYSQDIMVEDLRGVMDALGLAQAIVGGHSMGGNVALNFVLRYPERCLTLVCVGTGTGSTDPQLMREMMGKMADLAEANDMAAVLEEMKKRPEWATILTDEEKGKQVIQELLDSSPKGIAYTIRGVQMKRPTILQLESGLKQLPMETLVVVGELDAGAMDASRFMTESIPQAALEVIPGAGHATHLEAPEKFLQVVDRFVAQLEG